MQLLSKQNNIVLSWYGMQMIYIYAEYVRIFLPQ